MARIAGINIPQNKVVSIALTYIHGIGLHSSKKICEKLNIPISKRVNELSEEHLIRFWTLMLVAAKTKVLMLDSLLPLLDEISMSFLLEWMDSFPGSIIVFGEHANILNAVESGQDKEMVLSRSLFDLVISFTSYGEAKTLINNQKKFIDDE